MICVVTKTETNDKTKGIPLSKEGRKKVKDYVQSVLDYGKEVGVPYKMTNRQAIDDLSKGKDFVANTKGYFAKIAEEKAKSAQAKPVEELDENKFNI